MLVENTACRLWGQKNLFTQSHCGDLPSMIGQPITWIILRLEVRVFRVLVVSWVAHASLRLVRLCGSNGYHDIAACPQTLCCQRDETLLERHVPQQNLHSVSCKCVCVCLLLSHCICPVHPLPL